MHRPSKLIRPLLALVALGALVVAASGCGTTDADPERGRILFIQKCGTCHAHGAGRERRPRSGPTSTTPSRRRAKSAERRDTVEGVVKAQVEYPRPSNGNPAISMPADIVDGPGPRRRRRLRRRMCAGVPGAAPPKVPGGPGAQVFANNGCGGCHTLAAANAGGVTGPNLDEVLPGRRAGAWSTR